MKKYDDFVKMPIGASDIAALTVRAVNNVFDLKFGADGGYSAYIVDQPAVIGNHYKRVARFESSWIRIYDDDGLVFYKRDNDANAINIYRAGEFGCIIEFEKTGGIKNE